MLKENINKPTLIVNEGIPAPDLINKDSINKVKQRRISSSIKNEEYYIKGILNKDITVLSQAITLVESALPEHQIIAQKIIDECINYAGNSIRIGITGVPGVGKSTFIESFGTYLISLGKKVAVLAIDPSSQISKGSILGDKTRMQELSRNNNAFIRPSPSSGSLGGVARKTKETIILCEAAGFDLIIVETVGVGQSEIAVKYMVDFFLLLMLAGAGDELQGIKRGIMEMADLIAINKADGENIQKAKLAQAEYLNAIHLFAPAFSGWCPPVVTCSALNNTGLDEIWLAISKYINTSKENKSFIQNRNEQSKYWMYETIVETLKNEFFNNEKIKKIIKNYEKKVLNNQMSSFKAAHELIDIYKK